MLCSGAMNARDFIQRQQVARRRTQGEMRMAEREVKTTIAFNNSYAEIKGDVVVRRGWRWLRVLDSRGVTVAEHRMNEVRGWWQNITYLNGDAANEGGQTK